MSSLLSVCTVLVVALLVPQAWPAGQSNTAPRTSISSATAKEKTATAQPTGKSRPKVLRGKASWYGREFEGKKTASGTTFHANENTAAAKAIPLGATAKVTNLRNGRSTHVKVTDRGPMVPGRVLDVSKATAQQLGMTKKGVDPVKVTVVKPPPPKTTPASPNPAKSAGAPAMPDNSPR
jgi:rare lipoprotein A